MKLKPLTITEVELPKNFGNISYSGRKDIEKIMREWNHPGEALIDTFVRDVCQGLHPSKSKVRMLVKKLLLDLGK